MNVKDYKTSMIDHVPEHLSDSEVITYLNTRNVGARQMETFKKYSSRKDEDLSQWFNVSIKTFRSYKTPGAKLKTDTKEKLLLLLSLYKHGVEVFGTVDDFNSWLEADNFFFDGVAPDTYLETISGIRFVDDRLTALEYGDNV